MKKKLQFGVPAFVVMAAIIISLVIYGAGNKDRPASAYFDSVVGLWANEDGGSDVVVFHTETWVPSVLMHCPDATSDNSVAISGDGRYLAYTVWEEQDGLYIRRYLRVVDITTGIETSYFEDLPAGSEIISLSWMPDHKTLLFVLNDTSNQSYQEIRTLNIEDGSEGVVDKGEVWQVTSIEDIGDTAEDFFLKGAQEYLAVQKTEPYVWNGVESSESEYNYFLTQEELDKICTDYGGDVSFPAHEVRFMYVQFSPPRCSADGKSILYSTTLRRNSAPGSQVPLWMASAIWKYEVETGEKSIIYTQIDGGAIGRTVWASDTLIAFVSYYDFLGSRDSINSLDLDTMFHRVAFPYSDEHYNNVTLIPIGDDCVVFTSSAKGEFFQDSELIKLDLNSLDTTVLDVQLDGVKCLLEGFSYAKLVSIEPKVQ